MPLLSPFLSGAGTGAAPKSNGSATLFLTMHSPLWSMIYSFLIYLYRLNLDLDFKYLTDNGIKIKLFVAIVLFLDAFYKANGCKILHLTYVNIIKSREGGDIGLYITQVPKVI